MEMSDSNLIQQLLTSPNEALDVIFTKIPQGVSIEIAENLYDFFLKHGKLEAYLKWIVKREVELTKSFGELFREERYGVRVIQRAMFEDENIKCLRNFLGHLLKDITSCDKPLCFVGVEATRLNHNVKQVCKIVEAFVDNFDNCVSLCPINLRKTFALVQQTVSQRFPEDSNSFILTFITFYFFCPVIVNPKKYELVKSVSANAQLGLVTVSKLLNDLALNSVEKQKHPQLSDFITKQRPILLAKVMTLIDENDMESCLKKHFQLTKSPSFSEHERISSIKTLQKVLEESTGIVASPKVEIALNSPEVFESKLRLFNEKLNNPNWKKIQDKKRVSVYTLKQEDTRGVMAVKATTTVEATLETIYQTFLKIRFDKEWNAVIESFRFLKQIGDYEELVLEQKLPFPLSNRDVSLSLWNFNLRDRIVSVNESIPLSIFPKQNGYIRCWSFLGGWEIKQDESNPRRCTLTYVLNAHLGGSIPVWMMNLGTRIEASKVSLWASYSEQNQKAKDN